MAAEGAARPRCDRAYKVCNLHRPTSRMDDAMQIEMEESADKADKIGDPLDDADERRVLCSAHDSFRCVALGLTIPRLLHDLTIITNPTSHVEQLRRFLQT